MPELTLSGANEGSESSDVSEAGEDNELELDDEVWEDADRRCDDNKNGEVLRAALGLLEQYTIAWFVGP